MAQGGKFPESIHGLSRALVRRHGEGFLFNPFAQVVIPDMFTRAKELSEEHHHGGDIEVTTVGRSPPCYATACQLPRGETLASIRSSLPTFIELQLSHPTALRNELRPGQSFPVGSKGPIEVREQVCSAE